MKAGCGTSLVGSALQTQGAQVQSLLEELRSGMLWDWPKKKKQAVLCITREPLFV